MRARILLLFLVGACYELLPMPARAESPTFAIIDQTIQTAFEPVTVTALVYEGNVLRQYDAEFVPVPTAVGNEKVYRVAAVIPLSGLTRDSFGKSVLLASFFLVSVDGDFAATVVQPWTAEQIAQNARKADDLEKELHAAKEELPKQRARNDSLEQELERTKERASNLAEVEDIMGLKTALEQLKDADTSGETELTRLKELVKNSRAMPIPDYVRPIHVELSKELTEVAIATASTEHIRSNRRQSASANYFRKLDLARLAEGVDIRALAAQVLELRQKRKELEARLGTTAAELAGQSSEDATPPAETGTNSEF